MGFQIRVYPGQHGFEAEAGEPLLDAALRQGLTFPHGCRDGVCGTCQCRVLSGHVEHGTAAQALSASDRDAGFALLCCAHATEDLTIEAHDVRSSDLPPVKTLPVKVNKLTLAAPDVMIVELRLPTGERLPFRAGQYIDILLKDGRRRAFSLANAPGDDTLLQLHIRRNPQGHFTRHVFDGMKERDLLRINGPHGSFFLRGDSAKPVLLVAGGTGFAPVKAIVEQAIAQKSSRPMTLYWGARRRADLYLSETAERWAREHRHIRFVPVLSDPVPDDGWTGRTGFVHRAVMQDFARLADHQVYVCGAPEMVAAARRDFTGQCHLPDTEFFADSFELAGDAPANPTPNQNSIL